ncbi:unnamed protein product [Phyllotreta striolata]|uniref:Uncharacterized protein n=1 Tax=Phyllotreta striolata TaxID=444603 RepID=A0A9N9TSW1_PHYSR|nr:unnamed protein product [Phyllotreta striolata]
MLRDFVKQNCCVCVKKEVKDNPPTEDINEATLIRSNFHGLVRFCFIQRRLLISSILLTDNNGSRSVFVRSNAFKVDCPPQNPKHNIPAFRSYVSLQVKVSGQVTQIAKTPSDLRQVCAKRRDESDLFSLKNGRCRYPFEKQFGQLGFGKLQLHEVREKSTEGRRGSRVTVASDSKVYLNCPDDPGGSSGGISARGGRDTKDFDRVGRSIRKSKDLPKLKSRIFEDSVESQEISFYIGNNSEDETTYEHVSYDSFGSDTDSDYYQVDEIELRHNVTNTPLPPEPATEANGFDKITKNISRFKKNFSRDISKSLRRLSKRIYQTNVNDMEKPDHKSLSAINSSDPIKESSKIDLNETSKSDSILTRIKRSVSMSTVSVISLTNYFETQNVPNQRRSTFYLTDPINFDDYSKGINIGSASSEQSINQSSSKSRITRPKLPPPPVPTKEFENKSAISEKELPIITDLEKTCTRRSSWYATYDAEEGYKPSDYSKTLPSKNKQMSERAKERIRPTSKLSIFDPTNNNNNNNNQAFSNVIDELNVKLNKTNNRLSSANTNSADENDSNYNTQSVYSLSSNDSKKDDSSVTYSKNDTTFLDDEPLYQFYNAALLDSTYDDLPSDIESDIYEDVEEMNENYVSSSVIDQSDDQALTSQTMTFSRSLWCEIPQVVNSTVLSTLSSQQKKLQEAKFEIITSEASYLHSLNVLLNHFETSFKQSNIVNEKDLDVVFGRIKDVRACSKKILQDLEKCWQKNILLDGLCDLIQRHAEENFQVYIPYCENQIIISETLNRLKENPDFSNFLAQLESSPTCQFLSLYSFLMLPMQRITRWPLLVDAILKRLSESDPEYLTCQYALATMNKIVSQCNEAARKKEQEIELKQISESMEFDKDVPYVNIDKQGRVLVKSGSVVCYQPRNEDTRMTFGKRFSKITFHLFLFCDFFLVAKKKSETTFAVLHHCPRNLIELRSVDMFPALMKKDAQDKHLLYLSILENQNGKIVEFLLSSSSESEKERWIEAFTPPKSENPDETLYECWDCPQVTALHDYNASQPDELSLSRGDVINVLRKMNDGWYHGERLRDGKMGWFPANHTVEIVNPHVRARNIKQRHRLLTFSENYLKR